MVHQLKAVTLVLFLATNVLLLGVLGIDEGLGAAPAGFTHTDSGGGVTINVTYLHPQGANEIRFEVVMDSHTVNLDAYDLTALTFLQDETGEIYQPTQVSNKGSSHHREVTIVFPKVSPPAKRLELVMKYVGRVEVRHFDRFSAQHEILLWLGSFTMAPTKDFCDSLATAGSEALLLFSARS